MPFDYTIDPDLDLWCVVGWGNATGIEFFECVYHSTRDRLFYYGLDGIIDFRHVSALEFSLDEVNAVLLLDHSQRPHPQAGYQCAFLVRNRSDEDLVNLYGKLVRRTEAAVRSFPNLSVALTWLERQEQSERINSLLDALLKRATA